MASKSKTGESFLVRQAELKETYAMACVAGLSNKGSPLTNFLAPLMDRYPDDAYRGWYQRMVFRWLNPENFCFVACPASSPDTIVGEIVVSRVGDDEGAKRQVASRKSIWMTCLWWYYKLKFSIINYLWPDRSVDPVALRKYLSWVEIDEEMHWDAYPERKNRWHVQSCAVHPDWQRNGIGMMLMREVLSRARNEGVMVGLEASPEGGQLYRKCGFETLSKFTMEPGLLTLPEGGGVMILEPQKVEIL